MPDGGTKTAIDAGSVALAASGAPFFRDAARNLIRGVDGAWFSPLDPMPPASPAGTQPRTLDFPFGYNLQIQPKATEGITYAALRQFADGYDLLRLVIETRKDQVCNIPVEFRLRKRPGMTGGQIAAESAAHPGVAKIRAFFDYPDGQHDFGTWLRMLLEDLFVIDAPSILVNRTRGGNVCALEVIDGATIVPKIDAQGRRPKPPDVAFQQVIKGMPSNDLTAEQLIWRPRNVRPHRVYGFSPVEQILTTINIGIRKQLQQLDFYTEGTIPMGIAQVDGTWSADQIKQFQQYFDAKFSGNSANRSKLIFAPKLEKLDFPKLAAQQDGFDEWLARLVCFCFSISPTPFIKMSSRAMAKQVQETAVEEGLLPLLEFLASGILNFCIQRVIGEAEVEAVFQTKRNNDPLKQAQVDKLDVSCGVRSQNEVRASRGLDPRDGADALGIVTTSGFVPLGQTVKSDPADGAPGDEQGDNGAAKSARIGKKKLLTATVAPATNAAKTAQANIQRSIEALFAAVGPAIAREIAAFHGDTAEKAVEDDDAKRRRRLEELLAYLSALSFANWVQVVDDTADELGAVGSEAAKSALDSAEARSEDAATAAISDAVAYAKARAAEMVGMKWVGGELVANPNAQWAITASTRDGLRSLIEQAVDGGWSTQQLAKAIAESYLFSDQRADVIARTETAKAQIEGTLAGWKHSGVVTATRWLLASTHTVLDECDANAAASPVELGKQYPSGVNGPPAHPACKCALVAVLKGKSDE